MGRWFMSGILLLCSPGLCGAEQWPVRVAWEGKAGGRTGAPSLTVQG